MNRPRTDKQLAATNTLGFEIEPPTAVAGDGAAETSRSRLAAGAVTAPAMAE